MPIYRIRGQNTAGNGDETNLTSYLEFKENFERYSDQGRELSKLLHDLFPSFYFDIDQLKIDSLDQKHSDTIDLYTIHVGNHVKYMWHDRSSKRSIGEIAKNLFQRLNIDDRPLYHINVGQIIKYQPCSFDQLNKLVAVKQEQDEKNNGEISKLRNQCVELYEKSIKPLELQLSKLQQQRNEMYSLIRQLENKNQFGIENDLSKNFEKLVTKYKPSRCGGCNRELRYGENHERDICGMGGGGYSCVPSKYY